MNSNRYEISLWLKISLRFWVRWNKTQKRYGFHIGHFDRNEISNWHEIFIEYNLPHTKWISADSLDVAFNAHVRLKLNAGMDFISVVLTEMKFHVNRTCFHNGLKSQTGMSSFRLSCERTLNYIEPTSQLSRSKYRISVRGPAIWNEFLTVFKRKVKFKLLSYENKVIFF